jgi:AcrR family transcriptional regulator
MSRKNTDTRSRILEATWKLMEKRRGHGVRMTDIAAEVGISRQALYLHFSNRAELLIATTHYLDDVKGVEERLIPSRTAKTGIDRLNAFIDFWGAYLPEIYGVARALLAVQDTDADAAQAWTQRMQALREGCQAAIAALKHDQMLSPEWSVDTASDLLWTMLSVRNWNQLTTDCGWTTEEYVERLQHQARRTFVRSESR